MSKMIDQTERGKMASASAQAKMHRCEHVVKKKLRRGRVYEVICGNPGAQPMFTRPVTTKQRTRPQPRWFADCHWDRHVQVRFDGEVMEQEEFPSTYRNRR